MIRVLLCCLVFWLSTIFAIETEVDAEPLQEEIIRLRSDQIDLARELGKMRDKTRAQDLALDSLRSSNSQLQHEIESQRAVLADSLRTSKEELAGGLMANKLNLQRRTRAFLYILGALLLALSLALFMYRRRLRRSLDQVFKRIDKTKSSLEAETLRIDSKLLDLATKQLELVNSPQPNKDSLQEVDHSLVLKVADEVVRIQMNLLNMDPDIKGYKQLVRATESILDKLKASEYDIPPMLNKPYNDRMKAIATMILDENLAEGERVIRRILKPQINYQGKMVQAAEIVVAFND